ncbi:hypothetical protein EIP86_011354 [Pleurotus ostreatoroseus]|nr:hypothetical protein EIP86_011354 [Pleurotus ostreatoroseus]
MRAKHSSHSLAAFPVYSSAFVSSTELVLGGGGGQSRTGVKNKLRLYNVNFEKDLSLLDEYELEKGEDAPMSMAAYAATQQLVCGVNSSLEALEQGKNQNCRKFRVADGKLSFEASQSTLAITVDTVDDDFQKVTVLSPDGAFVAVAGTKDLSLLRFPSLEPAAAPIHLSKGEIYDATFSPGNLVIATTVNLLVYALPTSKIDGESEKQSGKRKDTSALGLKLEKTVEPPSLSGDNAESSFRSARFHPADSKVMYTVVNTVPPRARTKKPSRKAFVCRWDTDKWEITKHRKVSDRNVTCFDIR